MNVNYEYYKIFYYVAKLESFTKAASALQNSQPNITRSIHNLESQLGVRLFQRSKKGTKLTLEGEKLYSHVKVAIESLQKGEKELLEEKNLEKGSITIGVSEIALHEVLLPILSAFRKKYPGIAIHLINESTPSAMESLDRGQVDFALVSTPVQNNTYKTETISYFKEYVVASSMYEELKGRKVSMEE
ncbi:MAG: LysR family transcriptional regulator, partial [Firmicutes bacterium]|nr:LysR family transcriptional regulator [Bacillota bacterium]